MQLSNDARLRMRTHAKPMMKYYNDGGGNSGHCTWGIGILVHRGPCTTEELARPVTQAQVDAEFSVRVMIGGGVTTLSDRQARSFIGKSIFISKEKFLFNGKTCRNPPYTRTEDPVDAYVDREWRARVTDIALPDPVAIIDAECNRLYPMRKNHLMIAEDGVFFEAVRVKK